MDAGHSREMNMKTLVAVAAVVALTVSGWAAAPKDKK
jgi:cation transport ATPase